MRPWQNVFEMKTETKHSKPQCAEPEYDNYLLCLIGRSQYILALFIHVHGLAKSVGPYLFGVFVYSTLYVS